MSSPQNAPIPHVESRILLIRGQKVLLDADLAAMYQVQTKALNRAVKRNLGRFPEDFMFQLTSEESLELLRCQTGTSKTNRGGRRYRPFVFTEQGIAMLSGVLTSQQAIRVHIAIMRTFVRLRQLLTAHEDLARRLDQLEWRQAEQDTRVQYVFTTIQNLVDAQAADGGTRRYGFPSPEARIQDLFKNDLFKKLP